MEGDEHVALNITEDRVRSLSDQPTSDQPTSGQTRRTVEGIRVTLRIAERDGWYDYGSQAQADVKFLLSVLEACGELVAAARALPYWPGERIPENYAPPLLRFLKAVDEMLAALPATESTQAEGER